MVRGGMANLIWRRTVCNEGEEDCVTVVARFGLGRGVSPWWWFGAHSAGLDKAGGQLQQGGVRAVAEIGMAGQGNRRWSRGGADWHRDGLELKGLGGMQTS